MVLQFSVLEPFCVWNAGDDHSLDLNLGISTPSSGDGPKDNERLGHLQFHPYAHEARRQNVIVGLYSLSPSSAQLYVSALNLMFEEVVWLKPLQTGESKSVCL